MTADLWNVTLKDYGIWKDSSPPTYEAAFYILGLKALHIAAEVIQDNADAETWAISGGPRLSQTLERAWMLWMLLKFISLQCP